MNRKRIIFFGPPGAGKGTAAKLIAEKFGLAHISTGDMLRAEKASGSDLGKKVSRLIDKGLLVSDELMLEMVKSRVSKDDCSNGFILDGFPRTVFQAEELEKIEDIEVVYEIEVSDQEIVNRLANRRVCNDNGHIITLDDAKDGLCPVCKSTIYQRVDDNEETVYKRLDVYKKQTLPLIDFYKDKNLLILIDGNRSVDEVFHSICESLEGK